MRAITVIALAACGRAPPARIATSNAAPVVTSPQPIVRLVAANVDSEGDAPRTRVRFAKTAATGIVVTRTVYVPGIVDSIAWEGQEPVVTIDGAEVGRIAAAGYERFPIVPESKWIVPKPNNGNTYEPTEHFDRPRWRTLVSGNDVWQARCDWGWDLSPGIAHHCVPEGGNCHAWVYAHVSPGALAMTDKEPAFSFDSSATQTFGTAPTATPSPAIHAEIVQVPLNEAGEQRDVLKCTQGSETIQYPTDDDRDARDNQGDGVGDLVWLSTKPPLLAVTRRVGCLETMSVIFEGCKQSEAYVGTTVGGTSDGVLVLWNRGDRLALRWHDQDLGAIDQVQMLAFAPR